jgi:hypothetical protein
MIKGNNLFPNIMVCKEQWPHGIPQRLEGRAEQTIDKIDIN